MTFTVDPSGGPNDLALSLVGKNLVLTNHGTTVESQPLSLTTGVVINGAAGVVTSLSVDDSSGWAASLRDSVAFHGGGSDALAFVVNAAAGQVASLSDTSINVAGLGGLTYGGLKTLSVALGSGNDQLNVSALAANTATTVDGGAGSNSASVSLAGPSTASLTLNNFGTYHVDIGGDFGGTLAINTQGLVAPGTDQSIAIHGSLTASGSVTAQSITAFSVDGNLAGSLVAQIIHDPGGADLAGTGSIGSITVGVPGPPVVPGSFTGTIQAKDIGTLLVTGDFAGTLDVHGSEGDVGDITVDGSIDDGGDLTIVGDLTDLSVGGDDLGDVSVTGSGTIGNVNIAGKFGATASLQTEDLTDTFHVGGDFAGTLKGIEEFVNGDPNNPVPGTGTLNQIDIGGSVLHGALMGFKDSSSVHIHGDMHGKFDIHGSEGDVGDIEVDGSIGCDGDLEMVGDLTDLSVGGDDLGDVSVTGSGTIGNVNIKGSVGANATITTETIPGSLVIGGDLKGKILGIVERDAIGNPIPGTGTIASVNVAGSVTSSGSIEAGQLGNVQVGGTMSGPLEVTGAAVTTTPLLSVTQGGVVRQVIATPLGTDTTSPVFSLFYDPSGATPQVSVRVSSADPANNPVDLGVISSSSQGFDLARLDSVDQNGNLGAPSGIHDVAVDGNLLSTVASPAAQTFFGLTGNAGGVVLPKDSLGVVAVRDQAAYQAVAAASVMGVAFGAQDTNGSIVSGAAASPSDAAKMLAAGTAIVQASGTFQVSFDAAQSVALFLDEATGGSFDPRNVLFADQSTDNLLVHAAVTVAGGQTSTIQTISSLPIPSVAAILYPTLGSLPNNGASIITQQPITQAITFNGWLGDLILSAKQGITANVTAASILGNVIAANGPITGVLRTTVGDFGRALYDATGTTIVGTTVIQAGGAMSGQFISAGNFINQVTVGSGFAGLIAAQGDLGTIQRDAQGNPVLDSSGHLIRFGSLTTNGGFGGQMVVLGNVFDDITINGSGGLAGRIAVKGQAIPGLSAAGILGNVTINNGIGSAGALVSDAEIGDAALGTALTLNGNNNGIIAARATSPINSGKGKLNGFVFTGPSAAAVDLIFSATSGGQPFTIADLSTILARLKALQVNSKGMLIEPLS